MALRFQSLGLYWRIFLMLLVAQIAIAGGAVGLTVLMQRTIGAPSVDWNRMAVEAATAYRDGGIDRLDAWRQPLFDKGIAVFLVDPRSEPVDGAMLPGPLERWVRMMPADTLQRRSGPPGVQEEIQIPTPDEILPGYRLAAFVDGVRMRGGRLTFTLTAMVVAAVLLIALVTLSLTRSLLRPITDLRQVTNSVATGEFSKRIGVGARSRKDEIGMLAADFDAMAERIERQFESQRQLLRDVSHELKSPLARLKLAIELSRDESGEAAPTRWLHRLEKEAQALETMLDRILDLARADAGVPEQRRGDVDLDALIDSLVEDAGFEASKRGMSVRYEPRAPARVLASQSLLTSAIENVIRNAIHYGEADSRIDVALSVSAGQAVVSVANRGAKLRTSDLSRIFDPFYRVPTDRNGAGSGQGIGLTITQKVMLAHDGGVVAENRSDGGLVVRMTLPLAGTQA
ncbi:MAG: HAMP domain-containing protein [Thalassobaculaceae bacterium]|nr:HAMP domain-containing protein [Thalassobaculaceae bacterium]